MYLSQSGQLTWGFEGVVSPQDRSPSHPAGVTEANKAPAFRNPRRREKEETASEG